MVPKSLVATAVLMSTIIAFPPVSDAQSTVEIVRPVAVFVGKFLLDKLVIDEAWDSLTGKPNLGLLERRLRELEDNVVLRSQLREEIRKLREALSERVTRDEFRRMVERTNAEIEMIQQRLEDIEERVEKLEVENEDFRNKTNHAKEAGFFLRRGEQYEKEKRIFHVIACYNIAIRLAPEDANLYCKRSIYYIKIGAPGVGVIDASEAIRLSPKNTLAHRYRGIGRVYEHSYDQAIADLSEAIRLDPKSAEAYAYRGNAYFRKNDHNRAVADCTEAIKLVRLTATPIHTDLDSLAQAYHFRGNAYLAMKEYDKAIADCTEAVSINPTNADAYCVLADAHFNKNAKDIIPIKPGQDVNEYVSKFRLQPKHPLTTARKYCNEAISKNPKCARAYFILGNMYSAEAVFSLAVNDYTQAIRFEPDFAPAFRNRAEAYHANDGGDTQRYPEDQSRAIADATEAIRLDPKYFEAYCTRAKAYAGRACQTSVGDFQPEATKRRAEAARQSDYTKAIADATTAIRLNPKSVNAFMIRWSIYVMRKNKGDEALEAADMAEVLRLRK